MNKRAGDDKYYYIISAIIGIIVLGMVFFIIFQEFWTEETINEETCRQSVIFRSGNLPMLAKLGQEKLPFKCKTSVVNINYEDLVLARKEIANSIAYTWSLYGEGELKLFDNTLAVSDSCFVGYRIHFEPEVRDFYRNKLFLKDILGLKLDTKQTYEEYVDLGYLKDGFFHPFWTDSAIKTKDLKDMPLEKQVLDVDRDVLIVYYYYQTFKLINPGNSDWGAFIVTYQGEDLTADYQGKGLDCFLETIPA